MPSLKNVAELTEDGTFALFFRPHPGGFDSSRVPTPGNLPSKAKKMLMPVGQPGAGGLRAGWIDWCIKGSFFCDVVPLYSSAAASLKSQISYKLMNGQPYSGSHCCLVIPTFYFALWRFTVHQIWHVHIKEVSEVKFIYKVILDSCYLLIF